MEWIYEPQEEASDEDLFACQCGGSATAECGSKCWSYCGLKLW
jgi:hypothetical protein